MDGRMGRPSRLDRLHDPGLRKNLALADWRIKIASAGRQRTSLRLGLGTLQRLSQCLRLRPLFCHRLAADPEACTRNARLGDSHLHRHLHSHWFVRDPILVASFIDSLRW